MGYNSLATNLYPMSSQSLQSNGQINIPSQFNNMNFNVYPYSMIPPLPNQNHSITAQEMTGVHSGNLHPQVVHHLPINGPMYNFSQYHN